MSNIKSSLSWVFRKIYCVPELLLALVFPKDTTVSKLEKMNDEVFLRTLPKATYSKHGCYSLFLYRDILVRTAVWELKYKKNYTISKRIGNALHKKICEEILTLFTNSQPPLVVPIPISKKRRKERGFNQCEMIVHALPKTELYTVSTNTLTKMRDTPRQTISKHKKEREENVKGCFEANSFVAENKNIILVDDVLTTGSTLGEAEKVLYKAGACQIIKITIAR